MKITFYRQQMNIKEENESQKQLEQSSASLLSFDLIVDPEDLKCPGGKQATRMCVSPECSHFSIICDGYDCRPCGPKTHKLCRFIRLNAISQLLSDIVKRQKYFNSRVNQIDEHFIRELQKSKEDLSKMYYLGGLQEKYQKIIWQLFENKNQRCLVGVESKQFYKRLVRCQAQTYEHGNVLLDGYQNALTKLAKQILSLKNQIYEAYTKVDDVKIKNIFDIDSRIIKQCLVPTAADIKYYNSVGQEQLEFIKQNLGKFKDIQLIFRASEHEFKASSFHLKCGNIENTLTLLKTEYGKTIAAFTPYAWHSVPNGNYVKNQDGGTFILALDHMQKLLPLDSNKLIYNHPNHGPTFGGGHDLRIGDQCNIQRNSWAGCITSYNTADQKYKNNQQTYKAIAGVPNGCNFRILQYQVFRVIREVEF